jgi:4-hydroxybenzoyl-CoA thioesterase/acyl-CoA thioester hydrolase
VPREYRHKRRVQFYETDAARIVHFSWFFRYMEEAEHRYGARAVSASRRRAAEIGWPHVAAAFDYHRPLHFEEEFEVSIAIAAITKKTIQYTCLITRGHTKIATGNLTGACVSKRAREPLRTIDIPSEIAARLI